MDSFLLGNIYSQRRNLEDVKRELAALRQRLHQQARHDRSQEEVVAELQKQVLELQLYLGSVLGLLVSKQILTEGELAKLISGSGEDEAAAVLLAPEGSAEEAAEPAGG
jgi:hypothetical protein